MSKYRVFSGLNIGKYGPEKTPYLDTFQAVVIEPTSFVYIQKKIGNAKISDIFETRKWSFISPFSVCMTVPLSICLVNVNESAISSEFGRIYWTKPQWKTSFFVLWLSGHENSVLQDCWKNPAFFFFPVLLREMIGLFLK